MPSMGSVSINFSLIKLMYLKIRNTGVWKCPQHPDKSGLIIAG